MYFGGINKVYISLPFLWRIRLFASTFLDLFQIPFSEQQPSSHHQGFLEERSDSGKIVKNKADQKHEHGRYIKIDIFSSLK